MSSVEAYVAWMNTDPRLSAERNHGYGKCKDVCEDMQRAFPELELRYGIFHSAFWGDRQHFWLRMPDGRILDPTGPQHPDGTRLPGKGDTRYDDCTDLTKEQLVKAKKVPIGKCIECGNEFFDGEGVCGNTFCSHGCEQSYRMALGL